MKVLMEKSAAKDYLEFKNYNKKIYNKINQLIDDMKKDPYNGLGKPEALKGEFGGYYSRRINKKDRLVYKVDQDTIIIVACKTHYN